MADRFIISHDLGTSSDKAVLVTVDGQLAGISQKHYTMNHCIGILGGSLYHYGAVICLLWPKPQEKPPVFGCY